VNGIIKTGVKIGDAMTSKPISAKPIMSIVECSNVMLNSHVGSLIIMEGEKLLGIITEQDIVRKVVAKRLDPAKTLVKDVMITEIITAEPDTDLYDALVLMRDNNIRHLPVVHNKRLVGYLTIKDILKIQPQLFEIIVEKFELREEENKPVELDEGDICEVCGVTADRLYSVNGVLCCIKCRNNRRA
jgi:CBS domain-containing protein